MGGGAARLDRPRGSRRPRWQWRAPAHVYLTSYETLRADGGGLPSSPAGRAWDLVVLDEARRIKNPGSEINRVCKRLRAARRWALTGTPLENNPADLVSLLEFVDPSVGGDCTISRRGSGRGATWAASSCGVARRTCWRICPRSW